MSKRQSGFTLVELLVVIGIIATLIAILLPALSAARWNASNIRCAARMRDVTLAVMMYANDNKGFLPPMRGCSSASSTTPFLDSACQVAIANSGNWVATDDGVGLGKLYRSGYLKTTKVFACPSAKATDPNTYDIRTQSPDYYVLNPHLAFLDSPPATLGVWWRRLPNYGKFSGTGQFRTGSGSNGSQSFTNWTRAILSEPLYSYNGVNDQQYQTHRLGAKRAINMAYPDGSCRTLVIDKFGGKGVTDWYEFLDLSEAVQACLDGANVSFKQTGTNWIDNTKYGCIPIVPAEGN